jgi:hypothetical protein
MRAVFLLSLPGLSACASAPEGVLVTADGWVWTTDDPFIDGPDSVSCEDDAWGVESFDDEVALEVDTSLCNFLSVEQAVLVDVSTRDEIYVRLWHDDLSASEPAEGHAALWADGQVLWEQWVPIPSESEMLAPSFTPDQALAAGSRIVFHLHNHGSNNWTLLEVTRNPE